MLTEHCQWRESFGVDTITDEDFSELAATGMSDFANVSESLDFDQLNVGEVYWAGHDTDGIPTLTWRICKHDPSRTTSENFVRFFIHTIEVN